MGLITYYTLVTSMAVSKGVESLVDSTESRHDHSHVARKALGFVARATAGLGAADVVLKMLFYFLHERVWDKIEFGEGKS